MEKKRAARAALFFFAGARAELVHGRFPRWLSLKLNYLAAGGQLKAASYRQPYDEGDLAVWACFLAPASRRRIRPWSILRTSTTWRESRS